LNIWVGLFDSGGAALPERGNVFAFGCAEARRWNLERGEDD
jgi:hypothetical protein